MDNDFNTEELMERLKELHANKKISDKEILERIKADLRRERRKKKIIKVATITIVTIAIIVVIAGVSSL